MWSLLQYRNVYDDLCAQCDVPLRAAVDQRLERLRHLGNLAKDPVSKPIRNGIFECRAKARGRQARLLYFFQLGKRIVFVVGLLKDQPKLPNRAITQAESRRAKLNSSPELLHALTEIH